MRLEATGLIIRLTLTALLCSGLGGCRSGGNYLNENDRLREQVLDLEAQTAALAQRNRELMLALDRAAEPPEGVRADVAANTPRLASISLGRLSHLKDDDNDGRPDRLYAYVQPEDGLGRFLQIVGDLVIHVACLPEESDAITLHRSTLGPAALREAYRYSFAGIHYAVDVPLEISDSIAAEIALGQSVVVRVVFTDGYTGETFDAERAIEFRP